MSPFVEEATGALLLALDSISQSATAKTREQTETLRGAIRTVDIQTLQGFGGEVLLGQDSAVLANAQIMELVQDLNAWANWFFIEHQTASKVTKSRQPN